MYLYYTESVTLITTILGNSPSATPYDTFSYVKDIYAKSKDKLLNQYLTHNQ